MTSDVNWDDAACRQPGTHPDLWHDAPDIAPPGTGHPPSVAATICLGECPLNLQRACLRIALAAEGSASTKARYGVFGGANPRERYELWKRLHPSSAEEAEARSRRIAAGRRLGREYRAGATRDDPSAAA